MIGRIMGIDYGTVRVGIALSDPLGITAQGLCVLDRTKGDMLLKIKEIVIDYDIHRIVVGLPRHMNGSLGPMAREVQAFTMDLESHVDATIELVDERLTSRIANKVLSQGGVRGKKKKKSVDIIAAQLILQSYLNSRENEV